MVITTFYLQFPWGQIARRVWAPGRRISIELEGKSLDFAKAQIRHGQRIRSLTARVPGFEQPLQRESVSFLPEIARFFLHIFFAGTGKLNGE
jgi:hypothetical protein